MNVLVYDGPGVSKTSLTHTLSTLKTLLLPNYVVQTIGPLSVASDPWSINCALFVLPGGRDLPYLASFERSHAKISEYVRGGGSFLGLCAGAYFACRSIEWEVGSEQEVSGRRPLCFFDGIGRGCTYPGFQYATEDGARAVALDVQDLPLTQSRRMEGLYYNGGGEFVDADRVPNCERLATYTEGDGEGKCAAILCTVGTGKAVLWGVHPEYPLTLEPALSAIIHTRSDLQLHLETMETQRWELMRQTLQLLGLSFSQQNTAILSPTPQFLLCTQASVPTLAKLEEKVAELSLGSRQHVIEDYAETFIISADIIEVTKTAEQEAESQKPIRNIVLLKDTSKLSGAGFLSFDIPKFFGALADYQKEAHLASDRQFKMGEVLLYGEVVTSTQTLLDKNPKLLGILPTPLLSLARHQIAGRGRGSNSWLSPPGCLQFSLLLRLPLSSFPASKIVFVQYLFGLAVIEACRAPSVLGAFGGRVRLKWPNDIYAITEHSGPKKIGGILVNTSFTGGSVEIIIGCGLNVSSPSPLTSLEQLIPPGMDKSSLGMEQTAATIMSVFDSMWGRFVHEKGSFDSFMELYLERWLHSDQLVKLTTVDPPVMVRITGITSDHGLLRTLPESMMHGSYRGGGYIDLQPDGNSFDLMAGLIKTKT